MPVLGGAGAAAAPDVDAALLLIPATIAASYAFMLPVATPPNAIVFGSGFVRLPQMVRAGFWLNLLGALLVAVMGHFFAGALLPLDLQRKDRKSTRLNSSHLVSSRMPSSA